MIAIPSGFGRIFEADNGDGISMLSDNGKGELKVWAGYIVNAQDFSEYSQQIKSWYIKDGWNITYQKMNDNVFVWSGIRSEKVQYYYSVQYCDVGTVNFSLVYDEAEKKCI